MLTKKILEDIFLEDGFKLTTVSKYLKTWERLGLVIVLNEKIVVFYPATQYEKNIILSEIKSRVTDGSSEVMTTPAFREAFA